MKVSIFADMQLKCYSYDVVCQEIPEEITLAVNISCCPNRCPGCHSPWLWEDAGEPLSESLIDALMEKYGSAITCFCFMGGDADPKEIERFCGWIKLRWPALKTGWYSGKDQLPEGFDTTSLDYLKLGPYIADLGGLKSPDTNQKFYRKDSDGEWILHKFSK